MKKLYLFFSALFFVAISFGQLPVLPLDFESVGVNYTFTDFDGGATTKIANPQVSGINTSANVARMVKGAGQVWAEACRADAKSAVEASRSWRRFIFFSRVVSSLARFAPDEDLPFLMPQGTDRYNDRNRGFERTRLGSCACLSSLSS